MSSECVDVCILKGVDGFRWSLCQPKNEKTERNTGHMTAET